MSNEMLPMDPEMPQAKQPEQVDQEREKLINATVEELMKSSHGVGSINWSGRIPLDIYMEASDRYSVKEKEDQKRFEAWESEQKAMNPEMSEDERQENLINVTVQAMKEKRSVGKLGKYEIPVEGGDELRVPSAVYSEAELRLEAMNYESSQLEQVDEEREKLINTTLQAMKEGKSIGRLTVGEIPPTTGEGHALRVSRDVYDEANKRFEKERFEAWESGQKK